MQRTAKKWTKNYYPRAQLLSVPVELFPSVSELPSCCCLAVFRCFIGGKVKHWTCIKQSLVNQVNYQRENSQGYQYYIQASPLNGSLLKAFTKFWIYTVSKFPLDLSLSDLSKLYSSASMACCRSAAWLKKRCLCGNVFVEHLFTIFAWQAFVSSEVNLASRKYFRKPW